MVGLPAELPSEITAGDTAAWRRSLPGYAPADGWTLKYALVGRAASYVLEASADGDSHAVSVPAADTAQWLAGTYTAVEYVTKGDDRKTLRSVAMIVRPDLAAASGGIDTRTHARRVLDNITAYFESKSLTAAAFRLGERQLQSYPLTELMALRDRYAAIVRREECGASASRILVRL